MIQAPAKNTPPEQVAQYEDWLESITLPEIDTKEVREAVRDDLNFTKTVPVKEYTLWQKWDELNELYRDADKSKIDAIKRVKKKIWHPKNPDDYLKLEPELVFTKSEFPITSVSIWGNERFELFTNPDPHGEDWNILRLFVSTMRHGGNIGRSLRFIVRDRITKKYLGVICISGDFFDLAGRDEKIGWTNKQKVDGGMINHTAIGSVIVPTQPFGFNYVGGKLLALLCLSRDVAEMWEQIYGDKLVGVTTTSLYDATADLTQYDGLEHWDKYGTTTGQVPIKLSSHTQLLMHEWFKANYPFDYWRHHVAQRKSGLPLVRDANSRSRVMTYSRLGLKKADYESAHPRGVYFARLYKNTFEYLRGEIKEDKLKPLFDNSTESLVKLWRDEHAKDRIGYLKKKDLVSDEGSFYDEFLELSWDQSLKRYPPS